MLKVAETKTAHFVDYNDLNKFITEEMGFDGYQVVAEEEVGNDSEIEFQVENKPLSSHDMRDIDKMLRLKDTMSYSTGTILDYLCTVGKLDAGTYIVRVSW